MVQLACCIVGLQSEAIWSQWCDALISERPGSNSAEWQQEKQPGHAHYQVTAAQAGGSTPVQVRILVNTLTVQYSGFIRQVV